MNTRPRKLSEDEVRPEKMRFEHYQAARQQHLDKRAKEAWELFHNDRDGTDTQYTSKQVGDLQQTGAPIVSMNFMYPILSYQKEILSADPPMGRVVPTNSNDKIKASFLERLCDAVWRKSKAQLAYSKSVKEMLICYYSALHVEPSNFYNPGIFDLTISHTSWEDLYVDPQARESYANFRDAEAIYIANRIPRRKCKNLYGVDPGKSSFGAQYTDEVFTRDDETDNQVVLIITAYQKEFGLYVLHEGTDAETGEKFVSRKVFESQDKWENFLNKSQGGIRALELRPGVYVRKRIIIGWEYEIFNDLLPLTEYPLAILTGDDFHTPFGKSQAEFLREPQKAMNKFWQIVVLNAMLASNVRFTAPRGAVTDKDAFNTHAATAGALLEYVADATLPNGGRPEVVKPEPLNHAFYQLANDLKTISEYMAGTFPFHMGDPNDTPETLGATQSVQLGGTIRLRGLKARIAAAISSGLWVPMIEYVNYYGNRDDIYRYVDDAQELQEIDLDKILDDSRILTFDVQTGIKTSLPTDRERLVSILQTAISQIADPGMQRVLFEEVMEAQDWPVLDKVKQRFDTVQDLQGQLQTQQAMIKDLQALIDRLSTEALFNKGEVAVAKLEGDLGQIRAETKAKAQVALGAIEQGAREDAQKQPIGEAL